MFATLLGPLPRPPLPESAGRPGSARRRLAEIEAALTLQVEEDLVPLTDGGFGAGDVPAWREAAGRIDRAVKAVLVGPWSAAGGDAAAAITAARTLRDRVAAFAAAGCPLVEVHEPLAVSIGTDPVARAGFRAATETLLAGLGGAHVSLAITGGSADAAGVETLLAAPFASLALDLISGPDNWRLAAAAPRGMGLVCGALGTAEDAEEGPELLLFAARYGASLGGRGPERVGLATAGGLGHLPWDVAVRKVRSLGDGARIAALPPGPELAGALDPRAIDIRSAAAGRYVRARRRDRPG